MAIHLIEFLGRFYGLSPVLGVGAKFEPADFSGNRITISIEPAEIHGWLLFIRVFFNQDGLALEFGPVFLGIVD